MDEFKASAEDLTAETNSEEKPPEKKKSPTKATARKKPQKADPIPAKTENTENEDKQLATDTEPTQKTGEKENLGTVACPACGRTLLDTDKFCIYCGNDLNECTGTDALQMLVTGKESTEKVQKPENTDATACPACGRALLSTDKFCIYCGSGLNGRERTDAAPVFSKGTSWTGNAAIAPVVHVPRRPKWLLPIVIVLCVLVVTAAVTLPIYFDAEHCAYREAKSAFNAGDYENAYMLFGNIADFKDSAQMMNESRYMQAHTAFACEDYEKAQEIYAELADYKDSAERMADCSYAIAEKSSEDEQWYDAYLGFMEIENYRDARERALDCVQKLIHIASNVNDDYSERQAGEALDLLFNITGDRDAEALINDARDDLCCTMAKQKYAAGDVRGALSLLAGCTSVRAQKLYTEILSIYYGGSYVPYYDYYGDSRSFYSVTAQPNLRVRSGPGADYSIIGKLSFGSEVAVEAISSGWGKIYYNGQIGWISMEYVEPLL